MSSDFDFPDPEDSLEARFISGEAYRFDDNTWALNIGHVWDGTGLYTLGRSNNLNIYESWLLSLAASTLWEYVVEYREVVSLNDSIMLPFGGLAVGEVMYQMGDFFQHSSDSTINRALGYIFGGPTAAHRWLDNDKPGAPRNVDKFGFTTDVWHRFRLYAGGGASSLGDGGTWRPEAQIGLDMQLVLTDGYGKPGQESSIYSNGFFNQLSVSAALGEDWASDFQLMTRTAFLGLYQQDIRKDPGSGQLDGYSLFTGIGSAFEYLIHNFPGAPQVDKQAVCNMLGPVVLWDGYRRGFHVRSLTDFYPSFSMVMPYTAEESDRNLNKRYKNVFVNENYYYAFGFTTGTSIEITYGKFELDASTRFYLFGSVDDELNRYPIKYIIRDNRAYPIDGGLHDRRLSIQTALGYALPIENTKIFLVGEKLFRWNEIDVYESDLEETRLSCRFVMEF